MSQSFTIRGIHLSASGVPISAQEAEAYIAFALAKHPSIRFVSALVDDHHLFLQYDVSPITSELSTIVPRIIPYSPSPYPIDYDTVSSLPLKSGVSYDK